MSSVAAKAAQDSPPDPGASVQLLTEPFMPTWAEESIGSARVASLLCLARVRCSSHCPGLLFPQSKPAMPCWSGDEEPPCSSFLPGPGSCHWGPRVLLQAGRAVHPAQQASPQISLAPRCRPAAPRAARQRCGQPGERQRDESGIRRRRHDPSTTDGPASTAGPTSVAGRVTAFV